MPVLDEIKADLVIVGMGDPWAKTCAYLIRALESASKYKFSSNSANDWLEQSIREMEETPMYQPDESDKETSRRTSIADSQIKFYADLKSVEPEIDLQ